MKTLQAQFGQKNSQINQNDLQVLCINNSYQVVSTIQPESVVNNNYGKYTVTFDDSTVASTVVGFIIQQISNPSLMFALSLKGVIIPNKISNKQIALNVFNSAIAEGYTYNNITIAIDDNSLTAFAKQLQLLQLSGASDTTTVGFADINGNLVNLAFSDYKNLLLGAGQKYLTLWTTYKQAGN